MSTIAACECNLLQTLITHSLNNKIILKGENEPDKFADVKLDFQTRSNGRTSYDNTDKPLG
ncbi:hypothetical protein PG997_013679 [Apiospora hydei]|uniref:Uncharacterized protein n=1 Tax=Apiospora hydei TaxID=1337664 RepID=A0ABR1V6T5_9PEZI